jgi:hypothetical protein
VHGSGSTAPTQHQCKKSLPAVRCMQALLKKGIGGIKLLVTAVGPLLPAPGDDTCFLLCLLYVPVVLMAIVSGA